MGRPTVSKVMKCPKCGGNIVVPAYPGDGDYPVAPMCTTLRTVREQRDDLLAKVEGLIPLLEGAARQDTIDAVSRYRG